MAAKEGVNRAECEAILEGKYDCPPIAKRLARAHVELLDKLESADETIAVLSDNSLVRSIAAGCEDLKAGKLVDLSCAMGGCERQKLLDSREELAKAGNALAEALEQHCLGHNVVSNGERKVFQCSCDSCHRGRAALAQWKKLKGER